MTLEQNKKIALALIEEYAPKNVYLTDDDDISSRLNLVYAPNYQELSQIKKILRTQTLKEIVNKTDVGFEEYTLPPDMYQLKRVIALDKDNIDVQANYKLIGKNKILISKESDAKYILEYYAYPTPITEETKKDFELEIDLDVQAILPYAVANDVLKSDPSSDYTAFLSEYRRKLDQLNTANAMPTVIIEEGIL